MPVEALVGILENGSAYAPGVPRDARRELRVTQGATTTIQLSLVYPSGELVNVGILAPTLTLVVSKTTYEAGLPTDLQIAGVAAPLEGPNRVNFSLAPADTLALVPGRYLYTVWWALGGVREPVVPTSGLWLEPAVIAN